MMTCRQDGQKGLPRIDSHHTGATHSDGVSAGPAVPLELLSLTEHPRGGPLPSVSGPGLVDVLETGLLNGGL